MIQQIENQLNLNFISKNLIPITEVKDLGVCLDSTKKNLRYDYRYIGNE